jgi:hypothetical protein
LKINVRAAMVVPDNVIFEGVPGEILEENYSILMSILF